MSLATRCTACGTIFRIVEDQLRVSDGWVRCGRCAEVFDARELLFDIDREAPPAWPVQFTPSAPAPMPEPEPMPPPPAPAFEPPRPPARPEPAPEPDDYDATASMPLGPEYDATVAMPLDALAGDRHEPRWVEPTPGAATPPPAPAPQPAVTPTWGPASAAPMPVPEFVRKAEAGERWRRPWVRAVLASLALLLIASLALQATVHFRDALGALYPSARPALAALCQPVGCKLEPWKRADVLDIESTALTQIGNRNAYKLSLVLRNKSNVEVATPWVELAVSDASGALVARRVLPPTALTPALTHLPADGEQSFSLSFATGSQRVSGYTVNVFHP